MGLEISLRQLQDGVTEDRRRGRVRRRREREKGQREEKEGRGGNGCEWGETGRYGDTIGQGGLEEVRVGLTCIRIRRRCEGALRAGTHRGGQVLEQ